MMGDMTLVLDRKELVVRMESTTVRVEAPGERPRRIPVNMIGRVVVIGSPLVSCGVWRALAERGVPAVLLPSRGKGEAAWAGAGLSADVTTRMRQYRTAQDERKSLAIGRMLVAEKIAGQSRLLSELGVEDALPGSVAEATTREELMGTEGAAAAAYFRRLAQVLPAPWEFRKRNRRPPKDPLNVLFSLGYVLAGAEVRRIIFEKGLDPAIGFLHSPQRGREGLVLDLMEPLRPEIDRFAITLMKERLSPADFTQSPGEGCRMGKDGRGAFYSAWSEWVEAEPDYGLRFCAASAGARLIAWINNDDPSLKGERPLSLSPDAKGDDTVPGAARAPR